MGFILFALRPIIQSPFTSHALIIICNFFSLHIQEWTAQHLSFWVSTILHCMFSWSIHFSANNRITFFWYLDSIPLCIIYHCFFLSIGTYISLCILHDVCFFLYISLFIYIKYKFDMGSTSVYTLLWLVNE